MTGQVWVAVEGRSAASARWISGLAMRGSRTRSALAVGLIGGLSLALLGSLMSHETVPRGDDLIYERMAQHPLGTHTFPFAYRIGLPWLVHILPFGHTFSFELAAWVCVAGSAAFAYLLMRHLQAPHTLAFWLALALALSPPMLLVVLRGGRNPDAATVLFMMAGTLFVARRQSVALAVTLAVGVLFREAELFIVPLAYAVWAERCWDAAAARRVLVCALPALALYVGLHAAISSVGSSEVPGYGGSLVAERLRMIESGLGELWPQARRMFSIYGPLWVAAPIALGGMAFARRGLVLAAACLVSMTFALDWGRMILLAAPVVYPAGAYTLARHPRWRIPALAAFAVLIAAYAIHMQHGGVQAGIIESPQPRYPLR